MTPTYSSQTVPLSASQLAFVESVLALCPSVAVFDCDGTLWPLDSGQGFLYWEMGRGLIAPDVVAWARKRYADYLNKEVAEEVMCGEMVQLHSGLREETIAAAAREYFESQVLATIFPEMQQLTLQLAAQGCELWAVSSTNNWVVEVGVERFGIPPERVLAACVEVSAGEISDRLIHVPSGEAKATMLRARLSRPVDAAFGNSIHDAAMLAMARHKFAVNPNPDLEIIAGHQGWTVYRPG